ncbi:GWxTD domain-containing protein [bacterium]|nr:GWxTD domain-containing protein [bacterium]MBU1983216.1 GWxTD domain-containing protein [bacterium]
MFWTIGLVAALTATAIAAPKGEPETNPFVSSGGGPQFRCQLGQRLGTEADSLRLVAAVSVPYDNLVFLRTDSGFAASYELVTAVFQEGTGLFAERISREDVSTAVYTETNSRVKNAVHVDIFLVPPGEYRVKVTLTADRRTKRKAKWEGQITLEAADPLLRVSDIYWVSEDVGLTELGIPRIVESFPADENEAAARVQIYSAGRDQIRLAWTVLNGEDHAVREEVSRITPTPAIQTHEFTLEMEGLAPQQYVLRIEAEGNGRREVRTRQFSIRIPGIPASIINLDLAIRQLKYIATSEENRRLRDAPATEKERLFKEFWNQRDPEGGTAKMEEYYYRVEQANRKFSTHRAGWEMDRGRIFILYGEPTDIERHPFDAGSRPYEIWFYAYLSRRFVFVDYTGFGDYTLVSPEWGY